MKNILLILLSFFFNITLLAQADTVLVLSEIMFNPVSGNNEFIEIYNRSETQSFDLAGYKIIYYTSNPDVITSAGFGTILPPKSYAVILEGDYDFASGIYNSIIPPSALRVKISDNAFGTSGMANSSNRPVWFVNAVNDTIDRCTYSANNGSGYSDEKIIMNHDSLPSNWANSQAANGTPGFKNSVTPSNYDLRIKSLSISPAIPIQGGNVQISVTISNGGILTAELFKVEIFNDLNFDSTGNTNEIIYSQTLANLIPNDSITVSTVLSSVTVGNYQIILKVTFDLDEDTSNNKRIFKFIVYPPGNNYNDLVINEIMYVPSTGEPEWIEVYNRTSQSINLRKWKLSDNSSTVTISNNDVFIQPNSFFVLSKDSSIKTFFPHVKDFIVFNLPALNNTGDVVVLKDSLLVLIDSVSYTPDWGGSSGGKSLERIFTDSLSTLKDNWGTSLSKYKATPGYLNSISQKNFDIIAVDIVFNPPFPFFSDNVSVSAKLKNTGNNLANFSLKLFEDTNLDSIPDVLTGSVNGINLAAIDSITISLDFLINNLQSERGFYITAEYSLDQDTSNNYFYKRVTPGYLLNTIVINEIMYSPINNEPEWIELFNTANDSINLKNWSITDIFTTPVTVKINEEIFLKPKSFLVLAKDTSILLFHRVIPSRIVKINLPVLNNDIDGVVLKDNRGMTIDSVKYFTDWGGTDGKSLERISVSASSNYSLNWGSSTDIELSTPGRINTLTPKQFDLSVGEISFSPRFPISGNNVFIKVKVKNNGSSAANNFSVEFWVDTDSNLAVDQMLSRIDELNLTSSDSMIIVSTSPINNLQSKTLVAAKILFTSDEDTSNNCLEKFVQPGFAERTILINEVMYAPIGGEPEWIELVNVSAEPINVKNWSVSDILTTPTKNFITANDLDIQPGEYFILTKDTSFYNFHHPIYYKVLFVNFGSLGNTEDGIIIYDFRNGIIDSLFYKSSWGGKNGYSLERMSLTLSTNDSSNWITSLGVNRSTSGEENSIYNIPSYHKNDFVINEIMFEPDIDNSEFVEFLNISNDTINVGGWSVQDENRNTNKLSITSMLVPPNQYFLLIADSLAEIKYNLTSYQYKYVVGSSNLGLVNTGELILLKDARGNAIDSVWYSTKWHNKNFISTKNISLEKINPRLNGNDSRNWNSSVSSIGATPGSQNSIFTNNLNRSNNISVSPNPFSPDNDGFEDFTIINYSLSQQTSQVRIKIFDSRGRLVRTLSNNQPSGAEGSVVFDGLGDDGAALRIGIYIIFLEALNDNEGVVETLKIPVVVARKL